MVAGRVSVYMRDVNIYVPIFPAQRRGTATPCPILEVYESSLSECNRYFDNKNMAKSNFSRKSRGEGERNERKRKRSMERKRRNKMKDIKA